MNMTSIKSIWFYRDFILGSVKREFRGKFQNSVLGIFWVFLNPLAMILVYTVIFSKIMHAKLPGIDGNFSYGIYLCSGVLTWNFFSEIVGKSQNMFLDNANILKKLAFPRLCLPVIIIGNAGLSFGIIFSLFTVFLLVTGSFPGVVYLAIFPLLIILILFATGLGVMLGVLNVFFRDVGQFFSIFLQFWFWLTPIIYPFTIIPAKLQILIQWNPMFSVIEGFQTIFVQQQWPNWSSLWFTAMLAVLFCYLGLKLFQQHSGDMVDEL
jgi:lipopolysaccharide transport system permease protein